MSAIPDASVLELYPSEINEVKLITAAVSRKYTGLTATKENLTALASEIEGRCQDELNLFVICDPTTYDLDRDGNAYISPTVSPVKRLVPEAFDFAKVQYETQQGFTDGVPGVITEDGQWREPTKQIAMPGGQSVASS